MLAVVPAQAGTHNHIRAKVFDHRAHTERTRRMGPRLRRDDSGVLLMHIDAVDLEVVKASLSGILQEMQNSLFRTGFSTIVRESQDASCALMNAKGEVVAQHVVLPLHIGAFPACCGAIIAEFGDTIAEGDAFLINHPYQGGSPHAPDMCVLSPVLIDGALFGF